MEGSVKRGESVMGSHVGPQARGVNKRQMKEKNGADTQRRAELKGITLNLIDGEKGPAPRLSRSAPTQGHHVIQLQRLPRTSQSMQMVPLGLCSAQLVQRNMAVLSPAIFYACNKTSMSLPVVLISSL